MNAVELWTKTKLKLRKDQLTTAFNSYRYNYYKLVPNYIYIVKTHMLNVLRMF